MEDEVIRIDIIKDLKEIVEREVKKCNEEKKVPSRELLDTINILTSIIHQTY